MAEALASKPALKQDQEKSPSLFLDRTNAQLLYLFIKNNQGDIDFRSLVKQYTRVYYQNGSGTTALEALLHGTDWLSNKLVGLPPSFTPKLRTGEAALIKATVTAALNLPNILEALQRFHLKKGGPPRRPEDILDYAVQLLLLARTLGSDLFPWTGYCDLLAVLFQEAGYGTRDSPIRNELLSIKTEPCNFPYLPLSSHREPGSQEYCLIRHS